MKKLLLLFALASLMIPMHVVAQYSVASLNGPWIAYSQGYNYVIFDGAGTITDVGTSMDSVHPAGTYTVSPSGVITATLYQTNGVVTITGHMLSDSSETFYVDTTHGPYQKIKVPDTTALAGTWTGSITDTNTSVSINVQIVVNSSGTIISAVGIPLISGKIFAENGIFTGYITTSDTNCNYLYIQIYGSYVGDSLSGIAAFGKQHLDDGCRNSGTVHFTKNFTGITSINPEINFSVYPQPFSDQLQIAINNPAQKMQVTLFDMLGREVYNKESGPAQTIRLNNLSTLSSGLFLLMITADGKTVAKRIVKN